MHPKIIKLQEVLHDHFSRYASVGSTRAIVFTHARNSVDELLLHLKSMEPLCTALPFVGQAGPKSAATGFDAAKGQTQKQQQEVVDKFRKGVANVLVATCIGEEGLDIGAVDLVVFYDSVGSPIRMMQRLGRTGRKRSGSCVCLCTEGPEVKKFQSALRRHKQISTSLKRDLQSFVMYHSNPVMVWQPNEAPPAMVEEQLHLNEFRSSQVGGRGPSKATRALQRKKVKAGEEWGVTESQQAYMKTKFGSAPAPGATAGVGTMHARSRADWAVDFERWASRQVSRFSVFFCLCLRCVFYISILAVPFLPQSVSSPMHCVGHSSKTAALVAVCTLAMDVSVDGVDEVGVLFVRTCVPSVCDAHVVACIRRSGFLARCGLASACTLQTGALLQQAPWVPTPTAAQTQMQTQTQTQPQTPTAAAVALGQTRTFLVWIMAALCRRHRRR